MVVRQLEPRPVAREAHEHVDRLVANREAAGLLEAQGLVERDRAVDLPDPVAGVDELHALIVVGARGRWARGRREAGGT
jgi:hypothetical protein